MTKAKTKKQSKSLTTAERIKEFTLDLLDVQSKHGLLLAVDDANPYELVVRDLANQKLVAWLGTEDIRFDPARIMITED